jgi:hypothetical protein
MRFLGCSCSHVIPTSIAPTCAVQVMYEPSMRHAGMLLSMPWQAAIVSTFVDIMQRPDLPDGPPTARTGAAGTSGGDMQPAGAAPEVSAAAVFEREDAADPAAAAVDGTATVTAVPSLGAACGAAAGGKACGLAADTVRQCSSDSGAALRRRHSGAAGAGTAAAAGMCSPLQQSCRGVQSAHIVQQQEAAQEHQQQCKQQHGGIAPDAHRVAFTPSSPPGKETADRHGLYQQLPAVAQEGTTGQLGTLLSPSKQQQQARGAFAAPEGVRSPIAAAGVASKVALQVAT